MHSLKTGPVRATKTVPSVDLLSMGNGLSSGLSPRWFTRQPVGQVWSVGGLSGSVVDDVHWQSSGPYLEGWRTAPIRVLVVENGEQERWSGPLELVRRPKICRNQLYQPMPRGPIARTHSQWSRSQTKFAIGASSICTHILRASLPCANNPL